MNDQIKALERVLKLIEIQRVSYDKRSQEELAANIPLQYAGFCFIVAGLDAAVMEIKQEIFLLKRH